MFEVGARSRRIHRRGPAFGQSVKRSENRVVQIGELADRAGSQRKRASCRGSSHRHGLPLRAGDRVRQFVGFAFHVLASLVLHFFIEVRPATWAVKGPRSRISVIVMPRAARVDVDEPFALEVRRGQNKMEVRRHRVVRCPGRLAGHAIAVEGGFEPQLMVAEVAINKLHIFGADMKIHRSLSRFTNMSDVPGQATPTLVDIERPSSGRGGRAESRSA